MSTNATQHSPHTAIAPKCGRSPSAAPAGIVASGYTPHSSGTNRPGPRHVRASAIPATINATAVTTRKTENNRIAVPTSTSV